MTILNAQNPADVITVIREEWPQVDYCVCADNQMADEGRALFSAQDQAGNVLWFKANLATDTITRITNNGTELDAREF